jgi:hypothetical protein
MPFQGFNLKYPEYEVVTPQTHLSFTVRSLNVQDEERLKGSLMTPTKITEHLNKCIYETIVKKPETITEFKNFLKLVTLKDRDALLYGLYHITYEDIRNYDVKCKNCKKDFSVTVSASDTFNYHSYPNDDILTRRVKIDLEKSPGVSAWVKQPSLEDEMEAITKMSSRPGTTMDIITETLIIEKFEQNIENSVEPLTIIERVDIIDAYRSLPAKDKRQIYEKFNEEFGKYGVEFKMQVFCQHCGTEDIVDIDLVENFFRMVYTS